MKKKIQFNYLCDKKWNSMDGTEEERFCSRCEKKVINLNEIQNSNLHQDIGCGKLSFGKDSIFPSSLRLAVSAAVAAGFISMAPVQSQQLDSIGQNDYVIQTDTLYYFIEGLVSDYESDENISFVNIYYYDIHGEMHGTTSDFDGRFRLKLNAKLIGSAIDLHFRFLGYRDMEVVGIRLFEETTFLSSRLTKMESDSELVGLIIIVEEDQLFMDNFEKDFSGRIFGREEIRRYPGR